MFCLKKDPRGKKILRQEDNLVLKPDCFSMGNIFNDLQRL